MAYTDTKPTFIGEAHPDNSGLIAVERTVGGNTYLVWSRGVPANDARTTGYKKPELHIFAAFSTFPEVPFEQVDITDITTRTYARALAAFVAAGAVPGDGAKYVTPKGIEYRYQLWDSGLVTLENTHRIEYKENLLSTDVAVGFRWIETDENGDDQYLQCSVLGLIEEDRGSQASSALPYKIDATVPPGPTNDATDVSASNGVGYLVGSPWVDATAGVAYVCVDSTVGAAAWNVTSNHPLASLVLPFKIDATSPPSATNDATDTGASNGVGYLVGSPWVDVTANISYVCIDNTVDAAIWDVTSNQALRGFTDGTSGTYTTTDADLNTCIEVDDATPTLHVVANDQRLLGSAITFLSSAVAELTITPDTNVTLVGNDKINQYEAVTAVLKSTNGTITTWWLVGGSA